MSISGISGAGGSDYYAQMQQTRNRKKPNAEEFSNKIIDERDVDQDGQLSSDELGISEEKFNQADENGDGFVSQDELAARIQEKIDSAEKMMEELQNGEHMPDMSVMMKMMNMHHGGENSEQAGQFNFDEENTPNLLELLEAKSNNMGPDMSKMMEMMQAAGVDTSSEDFSGFFTNSGSEDDDLSLLDTLFEEEEESV